MLDMLGYALLLLPFAFFWANCPCCGGVCAFCDKATLDIVVNAPFGGDETCCDPLNGTTYTLEFKPDLSSATLCVWNLLIDCNILITATVSEVEGGWRWTLVFTDQTSGFVFVNASVDVSGSIDCDAEINGTVNPLIVAAICATGVGGTFTLNPPP